jgi:MFS family permease
VHSSTRAVFRQRDFRLALIGTSAGTVGMQMQTTAVGWEIYERTNSTYALGLVALVQLFPVVALTLPVGHVVDTVDRRRLLMAAQATFALAWIGLAIVSWLHAPLWMLYGCVFLSGTARAFQSPTRSAILPSLVPPELLTSAITVMGGAWQVASVAGPTLAGLLIALDHNAVPAYLASAVGALIYLGAAAMYDYRQRDRKPTAMTLDSLVAGLRFVYSTQLGLATITLDLFAVLLGGATTLLPVYAKDILHVGPAGLGWLNAADSIGAFLTAALLASRPPMKRAGRTLLWSVFGFGAATLGFGVSRWFPLSLLMLVIIGAFDMVSVVVRSTLVPLVTPDDMRGRVGAINSLFIGTSNQLGGVESGLVAGRFGAVTSVVSGAIGTLLVVAAIAWRWPQLRHLGPLTAPPAAPAVVDLARPDAPA